MTTSWDAKRKKEKSKEEKILKGMRDICTTLFYVWVASWYLAIWIVHVQLFLTGLFSLVLSYVTNEVCKEYKREVVDKK